MKILYFIKKSGCVVYFFSNFSLGCLTFSVVYKTKSRYHAIRSRCETYTSNNCLEKQTRFNFIGKFVVVRSNKNVCPRCSTVLMHFRATWSSNTLFLSEQFYKNTSLKIGAENNGKNNGLLFRTKENLRTTTPWLQFTWFL